MTAPCTFAPAGRRRIFWTTQPSTCGLTQLCADSAASDACGNPGLEWVDEESGRTFETANWVESLILNILGTDGRRDLTECGVLPGQRGGHWSDSYRGDNATAGTLLRDIPPTCAVTEVIARVEAVLNNDLQKLVGYGVAHAVKATASYIGDSRFSAAIEIIGSSGETLNVGITGTRLPNDFVWATQRTIE